MTTKSNTQWQRVDKIHKNREEITRPSLTYWADAWQRLKRNVFAVLGLSGCIIIVILAVLGPLFTPYSYSDQTLDFANTPPKLEIYKLNDQDYFYLTRDYKLIKVNEKGELQVKLKLEKEDVANRKHYYIYKGEELVVDYSYVIKNKDNGGPRYSIIYQGKEVKEPFKKVRNQTYLLGSDNLGRDVLTRVLYGARISLTVAFVASLVNLLIGVTYGSISGYEGGRIDNVMMRIVDIINSVPLTLYVILLMVVLNYRGLGNIIIALGSVYWVSMARLVRGQMLSLKEQEFVLAAQTMGVSKRNIILRHLIPNAIGPIVVSMTMMIPSAVFTESFLSFIGLGVSAPMASWGTLASDAITGLRSYPYQLLYPCFAIAFTMLAFNFLGDGLRDALDPRLRK